MKAEIDPKLRNRINIFCLIAMLISSLLIATLLGIDRYESRRTEQELQKLEERIVTLDQELKAILNRLSE